MDASLKERINQTKDLAEALRLLVSTPQIEQGLLYVQSDSVTGFLSFAHGVVNAVQIKDTGESGQKALELLLSAPRATIDFTGDDVNPETQSYGFAVNIKQVLAQWDWQLREASFTDLQSQALPELPDAEVDTRNFADVTGALDIDEALMTPQQRQLLQQVGRLQADERKFKEVDPTLQADEAEGPTEMQRSILEFAPVDDKPFAEAEKHLQPEDTPTLTDEQRQNLESYKSLADKPQFEHRTGDLDDQGLHVSESQIVELGEALTARSIEQQRSEFGLSDEQLRNAHETRLQDFVDPTAMDSAPADSNLDAIPTPKVIDADYRPLHGTAQDTKTKTKETVFDRFKGVVVGNLAKYEGETGRRIPVSAGTLIGGFVLTFACIGLVTIPAMVKSATSDKTWEQLASEQVQRVLQEEIPVEVPTVVHEETTIIPQVAKVFALPKGSLNTAAPTTAGGTMDEDGLTYARLLVSQGKVQQSLSYFEDYLLKQPQSIQARIELIQAYLGAKQRSKARGMCIDALKRGVTPEQRQLIWGLMQQCLTGK